MPWTRLTVAGLGIADFVLVFYTRPWQDIAANVYVSEQVKIIATSYLSGLSAEKDRRVPQPPRGHSTAIVY
jgi:hypothetical protein